MEGTPLGLVAIAAFAALVAATHYAFYKRSGGRTLSALWLAFSCTAAALLFIGTGISGYKGSAWLPGVIWPRVWIGVAFLLVAALLWRRGLKNLAAR